MNSQEEQLRKYLAKRERKKNRKNIADPPAKRSRVEDKRDPESFMTWFQLRNGRSRWIVTIFIGVGVSIGAAVFMNFIGPDPPATLLTAIFTFVFINLIFFGSIHSGLAAYRKFASENDVVTGWNQFLVGRSEGFWNTNDYADVMIKFEQDYKVSDLEKQALSAFTQQWINDWGYRYRNYKWTSGTPNEFNRTGAGRIEGHASLSHGIPFVIDQLMNKLPELVKVLTPGSLRVTIAATGPDFSTSIDDADEREEERRSDQRYREMMQRND